MRGVTNTIHKDEKAWSLKERNLVRAPNFKLSRYQIITVNRGDKLVEWWSNLGPVKNFTAPELDIPSLWEHSVAELQEIAEEKRLGDDYWQKFTEETRHESSLISDWANQYEERGRIIRNQSVSGPGFRKQRNGFSRKAAYEKGT